MSTAPNPQALFYQRYELARRDEIAGVLLALFLGGLGIHHFYLRRTGLGIFYLCICWTGITTLLGFIECFFMPGRVREYNAIQAAGIAASLGIVAPGWGAPFAAAVSPMAQTGTLIACPRCGNTNAAGARFCANCGTGL